MTTGRRVLIVGSGRIGRALVQDRATTSLLSGRELVGKRDLAWAVGSASLIVHAAGPAGEASCLEDPGQAFALHYTLTERLVREWLLLDAGRQLIVLGTVAPNSGFYGPLKRAATAQAHLLATVHDCQRQLSIIECGHVIGVGLSVSVANAGVIAKFVQAAVQGRRLVIANGGEQQIRYTPLETLSHVVWQLITGERPMGQWAPVSAAVSVIDIARTCLNLARLLYAVDRGVMVNGETQFGALESYGEPTGVPIPVPDLPDVLISWMRTLEVKILLGVK